jgi:hypothetical protein
MISTIQEQVTGRRRPDGAPNVRTITRTLIEGTITQVLTLTGTWGQPARYQRTDLMTVYVIDAAGSTVRVADTDTTRGLVAIGATVRVVADPHTVQADDYTARTLDVI